MKKFRIRKLKKPYYGYSDTYNYIVEEKDYFIMWGSFNYSKTVEDAIDCIRESLFYKKENKKVSIEIIYVI